MTADVEIPELSPIPRDRLGRPLIIPAGGGKPTAYTRCSTFAKALSDGDSLSQWKRRTMVKGLQTSPWGFAAEVAAPDTNVDAFIEALHEAGGGNDGAKWGTALHGLAEFVDADGWVPEKGTIPDDLWDGLGRYVRLVEGIEMIACEGFVVLDDIKVAGSYDRIGIMPDGRIVVADLKTGNRIHQNVAEVMAQLAMYARGTHYAPDGTRHLGPLEHVDKDVALVIQVSRDGLQNRLMLVDIAKGWDLVQLALRVRKERSQKPLDPNYRLAQASAS